MKREGGMFFGPLIGANIGIVVGMLMVTPGAYGIETALTWFAIIGGAVGLWYGRQYNNRGWPFN